MRRVIFVAVFLFFTGLEAEDGREKNIRAICDHFQIVDKIQLEMQALEILKMSDKTMDVNVLVAKTEEAIQEKHVQENMYDSFSKFTDEELEELKAIYESPVYQKVGYDLVASLGKIIGDTMRELLACYGEEKQPVGREIIEITEENFCSTFLLSEQPVVIDFYTHRCIPCRFQAQLFEELHQKYHQTVRFAKIDCEKQRVLAEYFKIRGVPTLLFFQPPNGAAPVKKLVGSQSKEEVEEAISGL